MKAVASAGYRAIALDMRGYGPMKKISTCSNRSGGTPIKFELTPPSPIPGIPYGASRSAPAGTRWSPMDPPDYVNHNVAEFQRTGFHGALNYYRAAEPYFYLSAPFKGAKITQPSFFIWGKADGLKELYPLTVDKMRDGFPVSLGDWNSTMCATRSNTKPLMWSVTNL
jgi:hypothetical protein